MSSADATSNERMLSHGKVVRLHFVLHNKDMQNLLFYTYTTVCHHILHFPERCLCNTNPYFYFSGASGIWGKYTSQILELFGFLYGLSVYVYMTVDYFSTLTYIRSSLYLFSVLFSSLPSFTALTSSWIFSTESAIITVSSAYLTLFRFLPQTSQWENWWNCMFQSLLSLNSSYFFLKKVVGAVL